LRASLVAKRVTTEMVAVPHWDDESRSRNDDEGEIVLVKIYCDTDTLFHNVKRQEQEAKTRKELVAINQLLDCWRRGKILMFGSLANLREIERTKNAEHLANLRADYDQLRQTPKDERFLGTDEIITDPHGGFIENPLVSDVQNEEILSELADKGLEVRDAQHITQAICNLCDVFLTRDEDTIIKPQRQWIENRFPPLKVRTPSELISELGSLCADTKVEYPFLGIIRSIEPIFAKKRCNLGIDYRAIPLPVRRPVLWDVAEEAVSQTEPRP
jgi:hypothetical protein